MAICMSEQPFQKFRQIWTAQELIDFAFRNSESKGASISSDPSSNR